MCGNSLFVLPEAGATGQHEAVRLEHRTWHQPPGVSGQLDQTARQGLHQQTAQLAMGLAGLGWTDGKYGGRGRSPLLKNV